ncbi:MAG: hypothetical protein J5908_00610 [Selenomonas sp.]|nr:hypothetical protein [Selenomonas sp.]
MAKAQRFTMAMVNHARDVIRSIPAKEKSYDRSEVAALLLKDVRAALARGLTVKDVVAVILKETEVVVSVSRLEALLKKDWKASGAAKPTRKRTPRRQSAAVSPVRDTGPSPGTAAEGAPVAVEAAAASDGQDAPEVEADSLPVPPTRDSSAEPQSGTATVAAKEMERAEDGTASGSPDRGDISLNSSANGQTLAQAFPPYPAQLRESGKKALSFDEARKFGLMSDDYHYVKDAQSEPIFAYLNFKVMDDRNKKLRCYFRDIVNGNRVILFAESRNNDSRFTPQDGGIDFHEAGNENGIYRLIVAKRKNGFVWESARLVTPPKPREAVLKKLMEIVAQRGK